MLKTLSPLARPARDSSPRRGHLLAGSVAGVILAAAALVLSPAALARSGPRSVPRCATPTTRSFTLQLPEYRAQMSGEVSFTCRSVDITGTLTVPRHPASTPQVVGLARAEAPAFGPSGKLIRLGARSAGVGFSPRCRQTFDSGWQQPANLPGDVGTIQIVLAGANGTSTEVQLHQPRS